jgi:hypothetical protein
MPGSAIRGGLAAARGFAALATLARPPAELLVVHGAGHNDMQRFPAYLDGFAARLNQVVAR